MLAPTLPVYVGCAAEDEQNIGEPLQRALKEKGIPSISTFKIDFVLREPSGSDKFAYLENVSGAVFILSPEFLCDPRSVTILEHYYRLYSSLQAAKTCIPVVLAFYRSTVEQVTNLSNKGFELSALNTSVQIIQRFLSSGPKSNLKIIQKRKPAPESTSEACSVGQALVTDIVDAIVALSTEPADSKKHVSAESSTSVQTKEENELFKCLYLVQKPTPFVVMSFSVAKGEQPTKEAELKGLLLSSLPKPSEENFCAVKSQYQEIVSVLGKSGVGKSTALQAIAYETEVREYFSDGIYSLILGEHASAARIIQDLSNIVESTGGARESRQVLQAFSLKDGVKIAAKWFNNKRVLIIIDDVWPTQNSFAGFLSDLRLLISNPGRIVLSTQFDDIAFSTGRYVQFLSKDPQGEQSYQILTNHIGIQISEAECRSYRSAVKPILDHCTGFPIALGLAGRALTFFAINKNMSLIDSAAEYSKKINLKFLSSPNLQFDANYNFRVSVMVSLELANIQITKNLLKHQPDTKVSAEDLFARLSVFKKLCKVPLSTLSGLWSLDSHSTSELTKVFEALNLISCSAKTVLIHDACSNICKLIADKKAMKTFHSHLLQHYRTLNTLALKAQSTETRVSVATSSSEESEVFPQKRKSWGRHLSIHTKRNSIVSTLPRTSAITRSKVEEHAWWNDAKHVDNYLNFNLSWHLTSCENEEELRFLMTDFRWILRRIAQGNLQLFKDDFSCFQQQVCRVGSPENNDKITFQIQLIKNSISQAWSQISTNPHEAGFQLFGRLDNSSADFDIIRKLLKSMCTHASRPWLMPTGICFSDVSFPLESEIKLKKGITAVAISGVRSVSPQSAIRCAYLGTSDSIIALDMETHKIVQNFNGILAKVTCVAISEDGLVVVCGLENGSIHTWDTGTGGVLREIHRAHNSSITCVAICRDGHRVASSSNDKRIRVWKTRKVGIAVTLAGHTDTVSCVAMSADGKRVATGSNDCTIRTWDTRSDFGTENLLGSHQRGVKSISMSADGRWILSCGHDDKAMIWDSKRKSLHTILSTNIVGLRHATISFDGLSAVGVSNELDIQTWNIQNSRWIHSQSQRTSENVSATNAVGISADGKWAVAGNRYGEVRIARVEQNMGPEYKKKSGAPGSKFYDQPVKYVGESLNGQWGVSMCCDGRVTFWNTDKPESNKKDVKPILKNTSCVTVSNDGRRVVLGSKEGSLVLWNADRCLQEGHIMHNHQSTISCLCFSPDSSYIVSGHADGTLVVWHTRSQKPIGAPLAKHVNIIHCIRITADGKWIVSGSADHTVRLWRRSNLSELGSEISHDSEVKWVSIKQNNQVTSVSKEKVVRCRIDFRRGLTMLYEKTHCFEKSSISALEYGKPISPPARPISDVFYLLDEMGQDLRLAYSDEQVFLSKQRDWTLATMPHRITSMSVNEERKRLCTGHADGSVNCIRLIMPL